jgi:hypothetical protein
MKNLFNSVKMTKLQTNMFDLSHDVKLSCDMGKLVPIMALECIPGDKHRISAEALVRFAPLLAPVMHRYDISIHYFFVPNRILWPNWEKYITNTPNEELTPPEPYTHPYITFEADGLGVGIPYGPLADYLGIPKNLDPTSLLKEEKVNAFPFAAYQCIYNEYYRDQNLIDPVNYKLQDGENKLNLELGFIRNRAWEHDYFTACLPFAQKGEAVAIPIGNVGFNYPDGGTLDPAVWRDENGALMDFNGNNTINHDSAGTSVDATGTRSFYDPNGSLRVEPTNINDLRRAFRLQEWLEKAARGGSRYIEWLKVMFGVNSSDKRLQRPEYICGTKSPVVISEVLNTTGTEMAPQGTMAGHGVSVVNGNQDSYYVEEHGYIMGIMSVMPKPAYLQGLDRMWLKFNDPTEYYFSSFANIGEQEVYNREIMAYQANGSGTFGYIPRYAEYRYMPNRVAGDFRTSLDFWHHARYFDNPPTLSQEFIECVPDKTPFAVQDETNSLYCQVYNKIQSIRPIPKYGTPSF